MLAVGGSGTSPEILVAAVAAKNVMTSVPDYLLIETAFTIVQWMIVGPLTAYAFSLPSPRDNRFQTPKTAG